LFPRGQQVEAEPNRAKQLGQHTPFWQVWPELQAAQAAPPVPQALVALPAWQVLFWQQPFGQLALLQTHEPLTQLWPAAQQVALP
jgi:hypothetical protein